MSIVERAIRKMQGVAGVPEQPQAFGRVVEKSRSVELGPHHERTSSARSISINQDALRAAGLLAPAHQERQIASQYRQIKRPLIADAMGRGKPQLQDGRLIMVASAMPGEGKTFTAINLAFSMAMEKDLHVLLVDADVAKPQISKMFGASGESGLIDALADAHVEVDRFILPTDVPNLSLLPAGSRSDHATELLASERMSAVMRELMRRDPARIVIFDSPPVLLTTESQALAQIAGQIVVVVRAGHTEQHIVTEALGHLPEDAAISLILNQSAADKSTSYYYGYGAPEGST